MRILIVLAYYHPYIGGIETLFSRLAEGLVSRGHSVMVLTSCLPGLAHSETIRGVRVKRLWVPRFMDRHFFTLLSFPFVTRLATDYDLVHTTWYNGAFPAYLGARIARRPVVFTALEVLGQTWRHLGLHSIEASAFQAMEKVVAKLPYDRYVAISQATYRKSIEVGTDPDRACVIHCGIDGHIPNGTVRSDGSLRDLCGVDDSVFLYLYYGRPGITKGVEYLLQAVPLIQQQIPHSHLVLILGRDPQKRYEAICRQIEELGPDANVHLVPQVPNRERLVRYLLDASCIVVPSLSEGFGLSAAEANALGLPLVATRAGSLPEVVSGQCILVEPGSSEAICRGVVRAWRGDYDPRIPPKRFSWDRMVAEYELVYSGLLTRTPTQDEDWPDSMT